MPTINKSILNATAYATLFEMLVKDGGTMQDMCVETGFAYQTVGKILSVLHKRRVIRIASWERDVLGRFTVRVWAMSNGKSDAPRPLRKSAAQQCKEYYAKQKQIALVTGIGVRDARLSHVKQTPLGMKAAA